MSIKKQPLDIVWNPEQPIEEVKIMGQPLVDPEIIAEITELRRELGNDLVLLGHHYQRNEVFEFADKRGDSLALSQYAATVKDAKYVVFLGVHFMAETADMLTPKHMKVILPDRNAGCTMADMADIDDIETGWEKLGGFLDTEKIIPITYINSTAAVKAFVGNHGGTICTSSNADKVIKWALERGEKIFFFPDQHLGRNTSFRLGIPLDKMIVWDPTEKLGGHEQKRVEDATVILWKGHCSVHQHFMPQHADIWRKNKPGIKIVVHPECSYEVVQKADYSGSTAGIINTIKNAEPGTSWAVGTENNLVERLGLEMAKDGKEVFSLAPYACLCSTMFRISPEALLNSLRGLIKGKYNTLITVDDETTKSSIVALNRMFEITG